MQSYTPHFIEIIGGIQGLGKIINTATMESCVNDYSLADNLIDIIMDNGFGFTHSDAKQNAMVIARHVSRGIYTSTVNA